MFVIMLKFEVHKMGLICNNFEYLVNVYFELFSYSKSTFYYLLCGKNYIKQIVLELHDILFAKQDSFSKNFII